MVDEIKAKVTVREFIKATVSMPEQVTGKVQSEVMLDPDVNLIKIAGEPIGDDHPVPVSNPNLDAKLSDIKAALDAVFGQLDEKTSTLASETTAAAIKTQTDKLAFDASGNLKTSQQGTVTVEGALDADVTGTVAVSGTPPIEIKTDSVGLAKEAGGNLAAIKGKTDNLDAKLSDIKSKTDNLDAKLSDIKTGTDKIPDSPSQEHITADDPHAVRVADGTGFIGPTRPFDVQLQGIDLLLRTLLNTPFARSAIDPQGRLRIIIDAAGTATPVSSLSTITTFPYGQQWDLVDSSFIAYTECQRSKMMFA